MRGVRFSPASGSPQSPGDPLGPVGLGGPRRLLLVAVATGVPALLALIGLSLFFVPLPLSQQARLWLAFPTLLLFLAPLWGLWFHLRTRVLAEYLGRARQGAADEALSARAYRAAQLLPYQLGLSKVALGLAGALLLGLWGARRWGLDAEGVVLLAGEAALVTLGSALYEVPWHRATLAPLLAHLSGQRRTGAGLRLSLRSKMLLSFGALTLFACGLSLFWAVMQYRSVAKGYIQRLNRLRIEELDAALREPGPPRPPALGALESLLRRRARDEVIVYHLPPGAAAPRAYSARGPAPPLPQAGVDALRGGGRGQLDLPSVRLSASYGPLPQGLGSVLIAQPSHRSGDLDTDARILVGFFVLLLLGAIFAVVLTAADLTRPVRGLQRLADAMAHGDLDAPALPVGLEGDEIGRLYAAFDEMRRALRERFRSSTEVHFALEAQVARRTAELERRTRERKEALEALERAQEELVRAEKMASMGRLVAGIAHEINNPVNAVVNTAVPLGETLAELEGRAAAEPDEDALRAAFAGATGEMRSMLRVIQRGARRTKEIVQTLHNYSRGDGAELSQVDLHRCLCDSLDLLQHDLKRGVEVVRDFAELPPAFGNAGQLQQVFMNLLTNAVQALTAPAAEPAPAGRRGRSGLAAPAGHAGESPRIRITTRLADGRAVVSIVDNGPGIPPEVLPRIFDPFFTTKDVGQGSGLGLSIVHSIVQRHGGAITVDSAVGQGTAVTITLPLWPQGPPSPPSPVEEKDEIGKKVGPPA